jgi:hypothetical protein
LKKNTPPYINNNRRRKTRRRLKKGDSQSKSRNSNRLTSNKLRAVSVMQGYLDASNIAGQSESEIKEFARLAKGQPGCCR